MARDFDGSTGYIEPSTTVIPSGTAYTVAAWVYPESLPANQSIFTQRAKSTDNTITFQLDLINSECRFIVRDAAGVGNGATSSDTSMATNVWQSVVGTRSGSLLEVFRNGVSKATDSTNTLGSLTAITSGACIGALFVASSTPSVFFNGRIADAAVWDVVLTQNEINAYAAGTPASKIRPNKLLFYTPIFGMSPEPDIVGGKNSTLNGTSTKANHSPVGRIFNMQHDVSYVENLPLNACIDDFLIPE